MRKVTINSDTSHIEISCDYDSSLVSVIKELPDRMWNKLSKVWIIPFTPFHAKEVVSKLEPLGFQIHPRIYGMFEPVTIKKKFLVKRIGLYDFQSEAIDFLNATKGRALIADEQGLGKTVEALYWISERVDIDKTLIVCPASVIYKWKAEIEKWDVDKSITIISKGTDAIPETNYVIMSYSIMTRKIAELSDIRWDCFIADECHKLKSSTSQRSRAAKNINSKYFLALSGTPILNRPMEFFNVLSMIDKSQWSSWWTYAHRYCGARQTYWGLDTSGASNLDELSERVAPIMIRRLKKDVLTELPDLTRTKVPVRVEGAEINTAYRNLFETLRSDGKGLVSNTLTRLSLLRQAIGRAKIPLVVEMATDILDADLDTKIVIYAVHKHVVEELTSALKAYGVTTITGDIDNEERSIRQLRFQEKHMPRVMIISSAGGEGIDLYRASVIIFAEREWGPALEEQAEARCHRIGQKNAVEAMYVIAKGTIDEDIDELIESKRSILGMVVTQADVQLNITNDLLDRIMQKGGR